MQASRRIFLLVVAILLILLFLAVPGVSWSDSPDQAARQLAAKLAAALPRQQGVSLVLVNRSSLARAEFEALRRRLEGELAARGLQLTAGSEHAWDVRVTVSENPQTGLLVAELPGESDPRVLIVSFAHPEPHSESSSLPRMELEKELIVEHSEPIVGLAFLEPSREAKPSVALLQPSQVAVYDFRGGRWQLERAMILPRTLAGPRDLHASLDFSAEQITADFPGETCTVWISPSSGAGCVSHAGEHGLADNSSASPRGSKSPAGQKLVWEEKRQVVSLGVDADGIPRLRAVDGETLAVFRDWGSQLAGVVTECATGLLVLATRAGDWTAPDALRAYEIRGREAVALSRPLEFSGPLLLMQVSGDGKSVVAVARNLETGHYEAHRLLISCRQ